MDDLGYPHFRKPPGMFTNEESWNIMGCIQWQQELWDALGISWRYDGIYHQHYDPNMYMYVYIYIHVIIIDMYGVGRLENCGL